MINLSNRDLEPQRNLDKKKKEKIPKSDKFYSLIGVIIILLIGIICSIAYSYSLTLKINTLESTDPEVIERLKNESLIKMKAEANALAKKEFEAEIDEKSKNEKKDYSKYDELQLEFLELVRRSDGFNATGALLVSHDTKEYYILRLNSYEYNNWTLKSGDNITIQKLKDKHIGFFPTSAPEYLYKNNEVILFSTDYFEEDFNF